MLCVVIKGPTFEEAHQQLLKARNCADLVEFRLDRFCSLDLEALKKLRAQCSLPVIFTLRGQEDAQQIPLLQRLIKLQPDYIDLESHLSPNVIATILCESPGVKLILSYHNFSETPDDLEGLYREMCRVPATFYKIAVQAQNSVDALRFMCWAKKHNSLIAISMGLHGQISRILAPTLCCPFTYAALEDQATSAPGQLSAATLLSRYHYRRLNPQTALYGLIGDPVRESTSDLTHNQKFDELGLDAIYIKMEVTAAALPSFMHYAKQLPFSGLSVTMPLKEAILPLLDTIDPQAEAIGAVNTLVLREGKITGYNTDGTGALNALEKMGSVRGKRVVILGAGGAAKAIAYEAHRRGAHILLVNRTGERAEAIARRVEGSVAEMASCAKAGYDILINCTPACPPLTPKEILPWTIVMDIVRKPKETLFLKMAKERGCRTIEGDAMFLEQALGQYRLWGFVLHLGT